MKKNTKKQIYTNLLPAFILPMLIFLLILFRNQIVPFGETTLLYSDMDSQYIEFMAEYRRVLLGQGSFFWSWHAGLGMNFLAIIAYYLASPFNLLLALFPENQLPLAVTVITTLKLGFIGAAFAYYLQKHCKTHGFHVVLCAVCYALCAYSVGYAFNIMWMDAMIWLPLLCMGIDKLLESEKTGLTGLILVFALSFLSQFYMSWMTGVFSTLYLLAELFNRKLSFRKCLKNMARFGICVGIAAGLSAFLLLPTFFVLKNNMGLLGQSIPTGTNFSLFHILPKLFIGSFDGIKDSLPHIYCGLPALVGMILYFTTKQVPVHEKISSGLITGVLLLSFWLSPLNFFWHVMDHPSWFPFRYAFLLCFWILTLSCSGFARPGSQKTNAAACLICAVFLLCSFFLKETSVKPFLIWNGIFTAAYFIAFCFLKKRYIEIILPVITIAELLLNGNMIISGYRPGYTRLSDYRAFHVHYQQLVEPVLPKENDFYRMEKTAYRNYNDPMGIGYPGISHFSSTANTRQAQYLKRLGFNCYATWCNYQGATEATDAMLRIRYEFGEKGKNNSLPAGNETWEHTALFPLFYFVNEDFIRYDFFSDEDIIKRQNDLLLLLDDEDSTDYFGPIPVKITQMENLRPDGSVDYRRIDPEKPAWLEVEITPWDNQSNYLYLPMASLSYTVTINGAEVMNGHRDYAPFPICLDPYTSGGPVTIRIETLKDALEGGVQTFTFDSDRLNALSREITSSAPELTKTSETSFTLKAEPSSRDRIIVSSIPFDAGWEVTSNGERFPLKAIHDGVLGFILPAGYENIEISYRPYGMKAGLILSGTALFLWLALLDFELKNKRKFPL